MSQNLIKPNADSALDKLVNREEILQICYWYQGEGFGEVYNPVGLSPFMNCDTDAIEVAMNELVSEDYLERVEGPITNFRFTEKGRQLGGRLFADQFNDYQKQGHGECPAGCCDGDDHSQCGDDCILH